MTSSAKRKREKKKDFQKPKLKVGKGKAKASNFTDTSFKAKSIVLKEQSILSSADQSAAEQFTHRLSLISHPSSTQRKETVSQLTALLTNRAPGTPPPQPTATILPKVLPLLHDSSAGVRTQTLKLIEALPVEDIRSHVENLLLWIRAGMTHIAADVRLTSLDVLEWLLRVAGQQLMSVAGGWTKTLRCFMDLLGWKVEDKPGKWSSASKVTFGTGKGLDADGSKLRVRQVQVFTAFIRQGLAPPSRADSPVSGSVVESRCFPLWQSGQHLNPSRSNAFGYLNLFGAAKDEESESFEDREDRQRFVHQKAGEAMRAGVEQTRKEGGEVGRASGQLEKALREGMQDFDPNGLD